MKKDVSYRGQIVSISIDLNYKENLDENLHKVIVRGQNCQYDLLTFISSKSNLEDQLMKIENDFMDWAESNPIKPSPNEKVLQALGYKKE